MLNAHPHSLLFCIAPSPCGGISYRRPFRVGVDREGRVHRLDGSFRICGFVKAPDRSGSLGFLGLPACKALETGIVVDIKIGIYT